MVTPRSTATWPSSGCSSPVIIRNSVVLPDPFGPTRPTFSPLWSAADASMKRIWWPFCLLMLSRRIMGTPVRKKLRRSYGTSCARGKSVPEPSAQFRRRRLRFGDHVVIVQAFAELDMRGEFGVANLEVGIDGVVAQSILTRAALHLRHPLAAKPLVGKQACGHHCGIRLRQDRRQRHAVLDRLVGALSEVRKHRMRGIAEQRK